MLEKNDKSITGNDNNISSDKLLDLLSDEISIIENKQSSHGWTPWAIGGAFASIIWLFINALESDTFSVNSVMLLYLFISLIIRIFFIINYQLKNIVNSVNEENRFYITMIPTRSSLFFLTLLEISLLFSSFCLSSVLSNSIITFIQIFIWPIFLIFLLTLILSIIDLPIPKDIQQHSKSSSIRYILFVAWLGIGILSTLLLFIELLYNNTITVSINDWRLSILLVSGSILLSLFLNMKNETWLLPELLDIKRNLYLRSIDPIQAKRRIDIILHGLTLNDVIRPRISPVIESLSKYYKITLSMKKELEIAEELIKKDGILDNKNIITPHLINTKKMLLTVKDDIDKMIYHRNKLFVYIKWIKAIAPYLLDELNNYLQEIDDEVTKLLSELKIIENKIDCITITLDISTNLKSEDCIP